MEELQNPYAENQEPENKPSSDANETRNGEPVLNGCQQVLLTFFIGLLIVIVLALWQINDHQNRGWDFSDAPLHIAVEEGKIEAVKKLLASGADIDSTACITLETPLHRAVTRRNIAMVKLLIDSGADLNLGRENDGRTPLDMAQDRGFVKIEQLLRANGASTSQ